jgi:hypothetical protein
MEKTKKKTHHNLPKEMLDLRQIKFSIVQMPTERMQEFDEVGDYIGNHIIAYDTGIDLYNQLILLHELVEYFVIRLKGLDWQDIDFFDKIAKNKKLLPRFPEYKYYRQAHKIALGVERKIITFLGQDWKEYNKFILGINVQNQKVESKNASKSNR